MAEDLLTSVAAGRLDPVYVLSSEHAILLDRAVAAIRDAVVPPNTRGFNYDVIEGKPTGARIVALAQTLPMMAQRRMVLVRDLASISADTSEPLLAYLDKPNPSTVVVGIASKIDKRLKLFNALSKKGFVHVLEAPRQLAPWVKAEAAARGVAIEGAAITRLVETVGDDLSRLALAVEQLGLYVASPSGKRAVTSDDVDELIADTRERSVFELTDAMGSGDRGRALAAVTALCDQHESAVGVVVMLARHVRQMSLVHHLRAKGVPRNEWGSRIGLPPFIVDKITQQARSYTPGALAIATTRLAMADRALKGDITLSMQTSPFTGPQLKALGRDLAERVILEKVVGGIVEMATRS